MKKKTTKKETVLDVLIDIRNILREKKVEVLETNDKESVTPKGDSPVDESKYFKVTFPEKTAKEIIEECGNRLGDGKFLYDIDWYKNEAFYIKEKTRPGVKYVSKEMIGKGKDFNECVTLAENEKRELLNMAELLYFYQWHFKSHDGKYIDEDAWSWSSSRSSYGDLVRAGYCDPLGVLVGYGSPRLSYGYLGVRCSRKLKPCLPNAEQA